VRAPVAGRFCKAPFAGRFCKALLPVAFKVARLLNPAVADGGLFCESWFWRADIPGLTRTLLAGAFAMRPADSPVVLMVRTGMCEAAAAGAVRAITERFCIEDGGVEIWPRALTAPMELWRFGERPTLLVTCTPFRDAGVSRKELRLMAWPLTKALCEATVTAFTLWAFTKLKL
jgi:hypothetical protein